MSKSHFPVSIRESPPISFDEFLPKDFPENVGAELSRLTKSVSGMLTGGMLQHPSHADEDDDEHDDEHDEDDKIS